MVCCTVRTVLYNYFADGVEVWKNRRGMAQELRMVGGKYKTLTLDSDWLNLHISTPRFTPLWHGEENYEYYVCTSVRAKICLYEGNKYHCTVYWYKKWEIPYMFTFRHNTFGIFHSPCKGEFSRFQKICLVYCKQTVVQYILRFASRDCLSTVLYVLKYPFYHEVYLARFPPERRV